MVRKAVCIFAVGVLLTGCASVPMANQERDAKRKDFDSPPEGEAGLYIFRDSTFGSALKKDIWVDGKCLGQSAPLVYFYTTVEGDKEHRLSTESEFSPNDLELYTEAGENYFIRQAIKLGVVVGGAKLDSVGRNEGRAAVEELDLAEEGTCSSS